MSETAAFASPDRTLPGKAPGGAIWSRLGTDRTRRRNSGWKSALLLLALAGCGGAPTDDILRGGVPARTDLHQTTHMPPDAIRSVARKDIGWRLIYHPDRAPANADQRAASALCRLERKQPRQITVLPMSAPQDDPGARMIDIHCA